MKSTSDIMVKSAGTKWKQIEAHVDRTQPYYSNKNVDVHRKGKNMDGHLEDYNKLMRKQFLPYLMAYNHKCVKQRKKSRMYGKPRKNGKGYRKHQDPVSDYLRHTKRRNERLVIFYLGNKDTRKEYYKVLRGKYGLTTEKIRDMENKALVHTAYVWNEKNPYLKVTDFATNTDEKTAHIHTRMAVTGLYGKKRDMATKSEKKKGIHHYIRKPSMSFNKALVKTYPQAINSRGRADNREAMRQMRKRFDPVILASFNKELAKNGINLGLTLSRTGKVNHFNLKTYQAHKDTERAEDKAKSAESTANATVSSSATLSKATSASYHDLASSIQSAVPSLRGDNGELITSESYLDIAKGTRNIGFNNNKIRLYGTEALSYANQESLEAKKKSMISNYRSNAVSEAQPDIDYKVSVSTKNAKSNANESASASASSSASSYTESISASLNASNVEWQRSTERSLEESASKSAKAKVKASVKASMATSEATLASSSNALVSTEAQLLKSFCPLQFRQNDKSSYRPATNSEYETYARNGVTLQGGSYSTAVQMINGGAKRSLASISSASSSIDSESFGIKYSLTSFYVGNHYMREPNVSKAKAREDLIKSYLPEGTDSIMSRIKSKIQGFEREHKWAMKIAHKLHNYHQHLKTLFRRFMPNAPESHIDQFANGTRYFKKHQKERQEEILFRMEDSNAQKIHDKQAQKENKKVYSDNINYHIYHAPKNQSQPSDSGPEF